MPPMNAPRQKARFVNGKRVHFGKKQTPYGRKMVRFEDFCQKRRLPQPAPSEWGVQITDWLMLNNSTYGDCVEAEKWHFLMACLAATGGTLVPQESNVESNYFAQTGGADDGLVMPDSYDWWKQNPDKYGGQKLLAWASVDFRNWSNVMLAAQLFGGVAWGVNLPDNCFDAINAGLPWTDVSQEPDPYMGHAIYGHKNGKADGSVITWGAKQAFSQAWIQRYATDCYVRITDVWLAKNPVTGIDVQGLIQAYQDLTGDDPGPITPPGPGPGPGPAPGPTPGGNLTGVLAFPGVTVTIPSFNVQFTGSFDPVAALRAGFSWQDVIAILQQILQILQLFQANAKQPCQDERGVQAKPEA